MSELQNLMQEAYLAHQNFKAEWNACQNKKVKRTERKKFKKNSEPELVSLARDKFWEAQNNLWNQKLYPLQNKFSQDSQAAVDEVIEFLEIDVPCHRCGYLKEKFLGKLKSVSLTDHYIDRIENAVLEMCQNPRNRREFADWSRLLIKIADEDFLKRLSALCRSENPVAQQKAIWLRNKILENRKDLVGSG